MKSILKAAAAIGAVALSFGAHAQYYCPPGSAYYTSNYGSSCTLGTCWATTPFTGSQSAAPLGWPGWYYSCATDGPPPPPPPAGRIYYFKYDNQGNVKSVDGPLSGTADTTTNTYDALNRLSRVTDPNAGQVNYGYDALDQLVSVSDPRSLVTSYGVDGLGNLNQQVSPDTGTTSNTYDAAGNVLTSTDAAGRAATYSHDALNRVTQIVHSKSGLLNVTLAYGYDAGANGKGRLTSMSDSSGITNWEYDAQGRVTRKTQSVIGSPVTYVLQYRYDSAGRLDQITYPSGRVVAMGFDGQGRVTSITQNGNPVVANAAYFPFGPVQSFTLNGQSINRAFDTDARPTGYSLPGETRVLGYDNASRITSNQRPDATDPRSFAYDNLDRLVTYSAPATTQSFAYDATGNRTASTVGAANYTYTTPGTSNRLSSVTASGYNRSFSYDNTGNTTSATGNQGYTATYDARGRLTQMQVGADITTYLLNGLGQRVQKAGPFVAGLINYFVYDEAGRLIGEYDATGAAIQETLYLNDLPVATIRGTDSYFIYADHLNTPRAITNATNQLVWRWEIDPFGILPADENPGGLENFTYNLRFPGQYFDKETNLHYNYFRDYDPGIGRYVQSDPIGLAGGVNTYAYVNGNPLRFVDRTGLCTDPGGSGPRFCIQQYIPDPTSWGFGGDNRGSDPNGGSYRASQWLTNSGTQSTVSAGVSTFGNASRAGNQGPSGVTGTCDSGNCRTISAYNNASNGFFPGVAPNAWHKVTIKICDCKVVSISGTHTRFPNLEIWLYGCPGSPTLLYNYDKNSTGSGPLNLWGTPISIQ